MEPPTFLAAATAPVAYVVVFSELSPCAKTQYARFLVENSVQFAKRPSDGRFIANIHLEIPHTSHTPHAKPPTTDGKPTLQPVSPRVIHPVETHSADLSSIESSTVSDSSTIRDNNSGKISQDDTLPPQLRRHAAFLRQFGSRVVSRQSTGAYTIESKLVRLMSDIYDARALESPSAASADDHEDSVPAFAVFARAYLKNRFGLKTLVEQQALELVEGLAMHSARQDVALFSRFLDGEYDEEALAFFFRARAAAQQGVSIASAQFRPTSAASARRRGSGSNGRRRRTSTTSTITSPPVWLSKQQIEGIAQRVFGAKTDDNFLQATRTMEQLLTWDEFLTVAVQSFINSQPLPLTTQSVSLSSTSTHAQDSLNMVNSHTSPSPSPLPPPPLPRAFDITVCGHTASRHMQMTEGVPRVATAFDTRAPPTRMLSTVSANDRGYSAARQDQSIETPQSDEVEKRLSSLLARMQQRQLQGGT